MTAYFVIGISEVISDSLEPQRTVLIKLMINEKEYNELEAIKIKLTTGLLDSIALAIVSQGELSLLKERGYNYEKIMQSENELDLCKRALYGKSMTLDPIYHTYEEIIHELKELVKKYPELIQMAKIGWTSQGKRDIWSVKISDYVSQEEDEPAILFSGAIHSNELVGVEICMTLINQLLSYYNRDKKVTDWINDNEIWFIPVINVDGYFVVTNNIDPKWRKNVRDNNNNGVLYESCDGIDLNRNFNFNWAHGGSGDSINSRFRGEYPFSESECVAVRDLAQEQKFLLSITYHSQGEVIFYPWIWRGRKAPDDKLLTRIANELAGSIQTMNGDTTYKTLYGAGTVGQTYPWFYGILGTFDFIVETGRGRYIFPPDDLKQIVKSNLQGAFYMLDQMKGPGLTGKITDAITGEPLVAEVWFPDIDTEDVERRTSNKDYGRYFRLLEPGKYRVIISKEDYGYQVFKNIEISELGWKELNVQLRKRTK